MLHTSTTTVVTRQSQVGRTCPLRLHTVNFAVFTPWHVKFLCCHGYACTACDVHVTLEASEIKRHTGCAKKLNLWGQERVLVKRRQTWCLCCSQTVKGSMFHPSIRTNPALWTRQMLYDVIWLLLFLTPYMAGHEIVVWLKLFEKAEKSFAANRLPNDSERQIFARWDQIW